MTIQTSKHTFHLVEGDGGLPEHATLISHFTQYPERLEYFKTLLDEDANTAYVKYFITYPIDEILNLIP